MGRIAHNFVHKPRYGVENVVESVRVYVVESLASLFSIGWR